MSTTRKARLRPVGRMSPELITAISEAHANGEGQAAASRRFASVTTSIYQRRRALRVLALRRRVATLRPRPEATGQLSRALVRAVNDLANSRTASDAARRQLALIARNSTELETAVRLLGRWRSPEAITQLPTAGSVNK